MKKVVLIAVGIVGGLGFLFCVVIPMAALAVGWVEVPKETPSPSKAPVRAERAPAVPHTPATVPKPSPTRSATSKPSPKPTKTKAPSKQDQANSVIHHTPTVRNISLGDCLALTNWRINGSYPGIDKTWQMVYTNGKGSAMTLNVDFKAQDVLPWDNNAAYLLQVNGCSIRPRS
jgi:hypothetical protein